MLTLILLVLLVLVVAGAFAGPRYYAGRRTTVIERDRDII